jgi:integrase
MRRNVYRDGCASALVSINGRKHYLGPWGTEKALGNYHRIIAEWLASGKSRAFGLPVEQLRIEQLVADYLRHCAEYYGTHANSELHRVELSARRLLKFYAHTPAVEFGVVQFKTVRKLFIDEGHSRVWINASMKRIVRMFKWAASEGRLSPAIAQALAIIPGLQRGRTSAPEMEPVKPVRDELVDATLLQLPEVVADMVRFHRLTGCRPAEVCMIRPCDIDRGGEVWQYRPQRHKTQHHGRERVIPVGPRAQDVLRPYLLRAADAYCFSPAESEAKRRAAAHARRKTPLNAGNYPGSNRLQPRKIKRKFGDRYNPRSYHNAVCDACAKAFPVPADIVDPAAIADWRRTHHWTPNQLRHLAATEIRRQFGLEAAQVVLGHAQANVTQVYAERDLALAVSVAKQVG